MLPLYFRRFFPSSYGRPTRPPFSPFLVSFLLTFFARVSIRRPRPLALWLRPQSFKERPTTHSECEATKKFPLASFTLSSFLRLFGRGRAFSRQIVLDRETTVLEAATITCH